MIPEDDSMDVIPDEWKEAAESPEFEYPSLEQFTTPVDDKYVALVGMAIYAFTYLEWQVVSIGQKIEPGFVRKTWKKTAGIVADCLSNAIETLRCEPSLRADLERILSEFRALVDRRNDLLHAHPATIAGHQRLHRWTPDKVFNWEPDEIVAFTHEIEAIARRGNSLFYDHRMRAGPT